MTTDVVMLPAFLDPQSFTGKAVVVFDVLRATTTITTALAMGVGSIHAFGDLNDALHAAENTTPRPILCGEIHTVAPPGFDMGNSPRQFTPAHAGRDVFLATTNGTKALAAVRTAPVVLAGALVNASAVAAKVAATGLDAILLCSGTDSKISLEDTIGAGAVLAALRRIITCEEASDAARIALHLFEGVRYKLPAVMRDGQGGRNIRRVNLDADIDFAARLDVFDMVGRADANLVIRPA